MPDFLFDQGKNKIEGSPKTRIDELDVNLQKTNENFSRVINLSDNIFNNIWVDNEQVKTSDGGFYPDDTYKRTDFIEIKKGIINVGKKTDIAGDRVLTHYCLYDSTKTKVLSGQYNSLTVKTTNDLKYVEIEATTDGYIIFDNLKAYIDFGYYVSQINDPQNYVDYACNVKPVAVLTDKTLEIEGLPAESKETGNKINENKQSISDLKNKIEASYYEETTTTESVTWTEGYYVNTSGNPVSSASYRYSSKISVNAGDKLTRPTNNSFRFICAYNGNNAISSAGTNSSVNEYIVPEGIDGVVVTVGIAASDDIYKTVSETIISNAYNNFIKTIQGGNLFTQKAEELETGNGLYSLRSSLIRNKKIIFKTDIVDNDWSILIAHGVVDNSFDSDNYSYGFIIDNENITPWFNGNNGTQGTTGTPWAHGLTITSRLCVIISVDQLEKPTVILISENGLISKSYEDKFAGRKGQIYSYAIDGTFQNCELSFSCSDIEKPIWLFGDSYVSISQNRYPYWLNKINCDNCLINSYPGEASENAMKDLKSLLNVGTPRFIIWALGMNDHDTQSAINESWLNNVEELIEICEGLKITLILATIPNVPNTSYNNIFKNQWIKSHNIRYIDFDAAIGAAEQVGATWPEGWISSDNVHPTEMGARVLAMQIIADVPELAQP